MHPSFPLAGALVALSAPSLSAQSWVQVARPTAEHGSSMVFDSARAKIRLFLYGATWESDGASWVQVAVSGWPGSGPVVHDDTRNRSVVFLPGSGTTRTWELIGSIWTPHGTATSPSPRSGHALGFDAGRSQVVLFGGVDPVDVALADTWQYDGTNWLLVVTPTAPPARSNHSLVHHAANGRMLLFGGSNLNGVDLGDTWTFDGANWSTVATGLAPPPRSRHALVYAANRNRTVLFGGGAPAASNDTWEFDGANWQQVTTAASPPPRVDAAIAFDAVRSLCVLFGGRGSTIQSSAVSDGWEYDGLDWRPCFPQTGGALAFDSRRGRMVLANTETWELDPAGWHLVAPATNRPVPSAMVFEAARGRCVTFGYGIVAASPAETWTFDGSQWTQIAVPVSPAPRTGTAMVYDANRERVVLFGGANASGTTLHGDTWEFDGATWAQVVTAAAPSARWGHAMAYDTRRGRTVLCGDSAPQMQNDTWEYDGSNWFAFPSGWVPVARWGHGLAFDIARGSVVLLGGFGANGSTRDIWTWDGSAWVSFGYSPHNRGVYGHAMAYDAGRLRMVVAHGGWFQPSSFNIGNYDSVWELPPPPTATWTRHGLGCAGSAGVPVLDRVGSVVPALGTSFPMQITSLPAQPGAAYLALGFGITQWNGAALPLRLGLIGLPACQLWIAPEPGLGPLLLHNGASLTWQLVLPATPALAGVQLAAQALVFDAAAPGGVGAVTNAGLAILH